MPYWGCMDSLLALGRVHECVATRRRYLPAEAEGPCSFLKSHHCFCSQAGLGRVCVWEECGGQIVIPGGNFETSVSTKRVRLHYLLRLVCIHTNSQAGVGRICVCGEGGGQIVISGGNFETSVSTKRVQLHYLLQ